jgi:hypothetical protein
VAEALRRRSPAKRRQLFKGVCGIREESGLNDPVKTTGRGYGTSQLSSRPSLRTCRDLSPRMQPSPNGRRVGIRIVTFEACSGFTRVYGPPDRSAVQDGLCHDAPALPVTQLCRRVQLRSISSRHIPQGNGGDEDRGRLEFVWYVVNKHKYFYWTVGTEDCGYSDSKAVWELYRKNSINVASEAQPGNHEWLVWRPALRDFAVKHFWSRIWTKRRVLRGPELARRRPACMSASPPLVCAKQTSAKLPTAIYEYAPRQPVSDSLCQAGSIRQTCPGCNTRNCSAAIPSAAIACASASGGASIASSVN